MNYIAGGTAEQTKANTEEYMGLIYDGAKPHLHIIIEDPNNPITIDEDDISLSDGVIFTHILNPDVNIQMGSVPLKELKAYIFINDKTKTINWNCSLYVQLGIEINNSISWVTLGHFYGSKPKILTENNIGVYEYVGYDYLSQYDKLANDFIANLSFPMTINDIFAALETEFNNTITLTKTISVYQQIQSNPFPTNCTYRQILSWCAEAVCGNVQTTGGGANLHCTFYQQPAYDIQCILTKDCYFSLNKNVEQVPSYHGVCLIDSSNSANNKYYPSDYTGDDYYRIVDNPILNAYSDVGKNSILTSIYNIRLQFDDVEPVGVYYSPMYVPMRIDAIGNWLIEAGDIIDVEDNEGNIVPFRVFSRVLRWNGGCTDHYECTGDVERIAVTEYNNTQYQISNTITNRIVDSLSFGTKGMALDASQGQILNNSISALSDKVDVIGTKKSNSSSGTINCSESTKSAGCSITITAGTWIVSANATIYKCVSGKRQGITVTSNSSAGQYNRYCYELHNSPASTTANQYYNVSHVWTVTGNTTLYVMLYNGNVSTSYEASIDAVRIL